MVQWVFIVDHVRYQLTCRTHGSICEIQSRSHFNECVHHTGWDGQWGEGVHFSTLDLLTSRSGG